MTEHRGRFRPFPLGPMFGNTDLYGVEDILKNGNDAILRNWQAGKSTKHIWKGTLADAESMCSLLNRDRIVTRKATEGVTSDTQKRYYVNRQSRPRPKTTAAMASFRKCEVCGSMFKGDKHCGE